MRWNQEREPGEPPQRHSEEGDRQVCVYEYTPPLTLLAGHSVARGAADVNTALLKTSPSSGGNRRREKRENMRL